ncbi:hypothetical protein CORC01_02844 [Colletotrichum orchidophilum]|uniref:Uncharacterized protein n=1 Tax=Colletotrichum orchidophilum TaxID=1209926 RepID=A0A1G4BKX5_9PEZI|nr:uncharacterized protein CORC01_02844 [Colletotrichum orchidophilum]OHF01966.1 hypothetical protein CORC01_02844 [Colletotrichum orchidophilum]
MSGFECRTLELVRDATVVEWCGSGLKVQWAPAGRVEPRNTGAGATGQGVWAAVTWNQIADQRQTASRGNPDDMVMRQRMTMLKTDVLTYATEVDG